jgi:hypothetical protein
MKSIKSFSLIALILICSFISVYRIATVNDKELSWDILGYYLYLPSTFIYHQPMLNDYSWLEKINAEKDLTGTLYMVSTNDQGEPMYFFLMGMAILYLPFFLLGHAIAGLSGFPMDGFSTPYQYSLVIGGIIYTIIGLIFLRKNLRQFFSEGISALIMIIIVFGTNYIHHLTVKNLETVNMLFMLVNIILWNTIKWHESQKFKNLLAIGLCSTLMVLVKPSEVFVVLIPLLWNITSFETFKQKISLLWAKRRSILTVAGISFLLALPQLAYWFVKTGHILYDSYKNPGVGLDIFSPHIINVLFSYRKGWLLYTPVMIFALIGWYFLFKQNRKIFFATAVYFLISFYIISSWSEWWYGAAYSARPLITLYPILAICLGYFLLYLKDRRLIIKIAFGAIVIFFIFLNQFQWWQLKHYILDPYRETKEYYWATFLKTSVSDQDKKLMMIFRDFTGKMELTNPEDYQKSVLIDDKFEGAGKQVIRDENNNSFYRFSESQEYYLIFETPYNELTQKDHAWVKASLDIRFPENFEGSWPCFVMTMERREGSYRYFAPEIKPDSLSNQWNHFEWEYLTPEIRNPHDRFKCYIWKRGKSIFDIDNIKIELFKKTN